MDPLIVALFFYYLHLIEKPIKCASEDIPLQKISLACSQAHLLYVKRNAEE